MGLPPKEGTGRTGDGRFALIIATTEATLPFDANLSCVVSDGCIRLSVDAAVVTEETEEGWFPCTTAGAGPLVLEADVKLLC